MSPFQTLTLEELPGYLHLSMQDIERLVSRNEIPVERQGKKLVFRRADIDAWASQRILGLSPDRLQALHRKSSLKIHDLSKQHAIIPELIKPDFIAPALTCRTKASIIREMVQLADRTGLLYSAPDLLKSIEARERLCSTALAGGIALLHPRSPDPYLAEDTFLVLGRTIQALPFGSPDGSTTDLFFLACCQDERIHLHVLARLCMMVQRTSLTLELREAADAREMYQLLVRSEAEVIERL